MCPIGVILNSWPGANKNGPNPRERDHGEIGLATEKVSLVAFFSSPFFPPSCLVIPTFFFSPIQVVCTHPFLGCLLLDARDVCVHTGVENTCAMVRVRNIFMDAVRSYVPSTFLLDSTLRLARTTQKGIFYSILYYEYNFLRRVVTSNYW